MEGACTPGARLAEEVGAKELKDFTGREGFEAAVATTSVLVVAALGAVTDAAAAAAAKRLATVPARLMAASAAIAKGDAGSGRVFFGFSRGDSKEPLLVAYGLVNRAAIAGPDGGSGARSWPVEWGGVVELAPAVTRARFGTAALGPGRSMQRSR